LFFSSLEPFYLDEFYFFEGNKVTSIANFWGEASMRGQDCWLKKCRFLSKYRWPEAFTCKIRNGLRISVTCDISMIGLIRMTKMSAEIVE
jgi:hypothetical protein